MAKNRKLEFDAHLRPSSKKFVPKAKMYTTKCKWTNRGKNKELFFTATASVTKFLPSQLEYPPTGYIDLQLGQYNKFKVNTRDFAAFAEAINQLNNWIHSIKKPLDEQLQIELDKYMTHQLAQVEFIKAHLDPRTTDVKQENNTPHNE